MRSHSKALFAIAALFALFALAPIAQAAPKGIVDFFGAQGTGAGQFRFVGSVAINQTSGEVYVVDVGFSEGSSVGGGQRIEQFTAEGDFIRAWGWGVATGAEAFEICTVSCQEGIAGSGDGQVSFVQSSGAGSATHPQIAIDQSDGSLYVADTGNNRIQKFSASGEYLDQFGSEGTEDGQFISPQGVAVDPVSKDVYVADTGNSRIQRFGSDGSYISQIGPLFGGAGEGEFFGPRRVAVDSNGRLYVLDTGNARIQRFTPAGAFDGFFASEVPLSVLSDRADLTIDLDTDHVFVLGEFGTKIFELDSEGQAVDTHGSDFIFKGLALRSSTGRIYASTSSQEGQVAILEVVPPPTVTIEPVTDVTSSSATFHGIVNPQGPPSTSYRFECTPSCPGLQSKTAGAGFDDLVVEEQASGLEPNTEYRVRLTATKSFNSASATSSEIIFTTDPVVPVVRALDPGPVTASTAWLGAYVTPRKAKTTFYVEYSADPDLGFTQSTSVPLSQDAPVGSGNSATFVNQLVKGLLPQTTYHYRIVADNVAGQTLGESRAFTTPAAPTGVPLHGLPDGRVWEKVSPAYKGGGDISYREDLGIEDVVSKARAAEGGEVVVFGSAGKFAGGEGAPATSQYLARRRTNGWSTEGINLPQNPVPGAPANPNYYQWFSRDLSRGVAMTQAALNPGDPMNVYNLYLRDHETGQASTVSNGDVSTPVDTRFRLEGVSPDETHFFFAGRPSGNIGKPAPLMERTPSGDVRVVSVLPDDTVDVGWLGNGSFTIRAPGFNAISEDSSRVFFSTDSFPGSADAADNPLYIREDGINTTLISASERTGDDPSVPRDGDFVAASSDGSVAFFTSAAKLTNDANVGVGVPGCTEGHSEVCRSLYRYDADAELGERLTDLTTGDPQGAHALDVTGISDDGDSLYFVAVGRLADSGSRSRPNLYLWRAGGGIRFIATLANQSNLSQDGDDSGLWVRDLQSGGAVEADKPELYRSARVTPDGRYIAFATKVSQTGYDTNGKRAIYLYDRNTDRVSCLSCGAVETKSKGHAWFTSDGAETGSGYGHGYFKRNLRDDGRSLIFDSQDALVSEDTNGVTDVYQWQEGQLHLLSSGTSGFPSRLVDASADGDDVFFTTVQRLTVSDRDELVDLYDARVGGVPETEVAPPCVGDECQETPKSPPNFQTPSSSGFRSAGNPSRPRSRCVKSKVFRKGRCVKRNTRRAKGSKRANNNRRAGR